MKSLHSVFAVGCAGLVLAAGFLPPRARGAAASPVLRAQIDALLKARQWPEPMPIDPPSPFVVINDSARNLLAASTGRSPAPTSSSVARSGDEARPADFIRTPAPAADAVQLSAAEILGNTAARLKLGGVMQLKDQMQIVVNDLPRREGDFVTVLWNNATYALRIIRVQPGLLVLRYEGAEMTLRF